MPTIEVNLDAGLNTQDDPKRLGLNGFTTLQNVRHANGKLMKRFGTGTTTTIASALIDNMAVFASRKLQSVKVVLGTSGSQSTYYFTESTKKLNLSDTDGVIIPGSESKDWTTVFKVGDSIYINSVLADNDSIFTISAITSTEMTFENAPTDEGTSGSPIEAGTFTLGFAYTVTNALNKTVAHIPYSSSSSFNGNALFCTYSDGTNRHIGFLNSNNYGDFTSILTLSNSSDIHMRLNAYTDAVRFNSGLENTPYIVKYVNRHFFNGMLKTTYNDNCEQLYPHWLIDAAVPPQPSASLIQAPLTEIFEARDATASNSYVKGALNTIDNEYRYKLIPVYDGVQEEILDNAIFETTTSTVEKIPESYGVLGPKTSCLRMFFILLLSELNPRMSSMNLYRSTNNGPYYKINSIYLGDNHPNHKLLETIYSGSDAFWSIGGTADAMDTAYNRLCVDGYAFDFDGGTEDDDHAGGGYNVVQLESAASDYIDEFVAIVNNDSRMDPLYYGAQKICIWNKKSEETDTIFSNNGEAIGGSATGGWFVFAGNVDNGEYAGATATIGSLGSISDTDDAATDGPFDVAFADGNAGEDAGAFHRKFYGASETFSMEKGSMGTGFSTSVPQIVSGWIMAEGFSSENSKWSVFVGEAGTEDETGNGELLIAQGGGGLENQNIDKWRWFQYQYTPANATQYLYVRTVHPEGWVGFIGAKIRLKAFAVRQSRPGFDLTDNMRAFAGRNVLYGSEITDIGAPDGALAGARIQDISTANGGYPLEHDGSMTFVADNNGPFIQTVGDVPSVDTTLSNTDYHFGTNHYQWYAATNNTGPSMQLDFFDPGLPDGARHPISGTTSLDVKHKYSTILNGRQFAANVKITSDTEPEEYPNFVLFSEANAPDIIPVSNYLQLQDLQGGEIVGIESLMSDLVVFMTHGIFRISVPGSNPASWSLVESHPNIGCLHDKGIAKAPNGIYFLSQENIIFLDSGFKATPITYPIRDEYQNNVVTNSDVMRLHYDVKHNRLYALKSNTTNTNFWMYDILRQTWSIELHDGASYDELALDNDNNILLIETAASSKIRDAVDVTSYQDKGSVAIAMNAITGEQELTSYDKNAYIRRVNTNTDKGGGSGLLSLSVVSATTVTKTNSLDGAQSWRTSQRGQKVKIGVSNLTNEDNAKEISRIEVEYE